MHACTSSCAVCYWEFFNGLLVLMPRWQGGFRYKGTNYQIAVNGQTGLVKGDRPWSMAKIVLATIVALIVIVLVIVMINANS
jgi:hypothetical protein